MTTNGFFSVTNTNPEPIAEVTFDWNGVAGHSSTVFDCDQLMIGKFWFGNGSASTCQGTYRNGSDVSCGLIYDSANTYVNSGGCSNTNCGFIATGGSGASHKKLRFRFAPGQFTQGKKFEFGCDTDLGPGNSGGAMRGMKVTVKLQSGRVLNGHLKMKGYERAEARL